MSVCVSEAKKQSQVVNRCAYKEDSEGAHMGDFFCAAECESFSKMGSQMGRQKGGVDQR